VNSQGLLYQLDELINAHSKEWEDRGYPPPSKQIIAQVTTILSALIDASTIPDRIVASAEGGIAFIFLGKNRRYINLEFFNDGKVVIGLDDPSKEPEIEEIS
jgi:hypothetical protein